MLALFLERSILMKVEFELIEKSFTPEDGNSIKYLFYKEN